MPDTAPAPAVVHLLQTQPVPVHPSRYRDHTLPMPDASRMLWQSFESSLHRILCLPEILPSDNQSVHFQYQILYYVSSYPVSYLFVHSLAYTICIIYIDLFIPLAYASASFISVSLYLLHTPSAPFISASLYRSSYRIQFHDLQQLLRRRRIAFSYSLQHRTVSSVSFY